LLLLNSAVARSRPLFCLHAGFGTVFDYEPLARLLEGRCSVYGIQCRMLLDRQWQDESLQSMAIDYAQYIRQKQAHGPYRLLGWSLGGPLALLVAKELQAQGQAVEFVGLVDSYIPTPTPAVSHWHADLQDFLQATLGQTCTKVLPQTLRQPVVEGIISGLQSAQVAQGAYGQLDAAELAQAFMVGMRLKALAQSFSELPHVAVDTHCWWGTGVTVAQQQAFEDCLPQLAGQGRMGAGHFELLQTPQLLQQLSHLLRGAQLIAE
jgi:thioesterase domain-containing protein